jgi:hypothetical protein
MYDINLLIMLLIISGIGFVLFLLHEARENFEKKNKGVDEFDILSEISDDDMEDYDDEDVVEPTESMRLILRKQQLKSLQHQRKKK